MKEIELKKESYVFKCGFIYNQESILMGSKARIVIEPRLYVNSQLADLSIINNPSV